MTAWRAIGASRWAFDGLLTGHADPGNVTDMYLVDSFNEESGFAAGARAIGVTHVDITDHVEVDSDTWESTGTCTLLRTYSGSPVVGLDA